MKKINLTTAIALSLPLGAATAASAPSFQPLANQPAAGELSIDASPMRKPAASILKAPRVSEMRLVQGPDGQLHVMCKEIPNPRLRDHDHATAGEGQ